ncbi:MAG: helix-turn-helix domain-containing protein [Pseudomonadota bacterium]
MSAGLIKDLCWVAARAAENQQLNGNEKAIDLSRVDQPASASPSKVRGQIHEVLTMSGNGRPVSNFSGGKLTVDTSLDALKEPFDLLFLSAFWGLPDEALKSNKVLIRALPKIQAQGVPIAALSNASFLLAAAGLLDHKLATVYPLQAGDFIRLFPNVDLHPERAMTDAGGVYCANGIASGCDLIVSMLQALFGESVAQRLSREFLLGFQRSYEVADVAFDGQKYHGDQQVLRAQALLERDFQKPAHVEALAAELGMSPRNFSRRFRAATGSSASQYLQRVRVEAAKDLLRETDLAIAEIARRVGYEDLSYFSRMFERTTGALPHIFRDRLRLK